MRVFINRPFMGKWISFFNSCISSILTLLLLLILSLFPPNLSALPSFIPPSDNPNSFNVLDTNNSENHESSSLEPQRQQQLESIKNKIDSLIEEIIEEYKNAHTSTQNDNNPPQEILDFEKFLESNNPQEKESEASILHQIITTEKANLDTRIEQEGSESVLTKLDDQRNIFIHQLEDGTYYKISMNTLRGTNKKNSTSSKAVLLYIRLTDPSVKSSKAKDQKFLSTTYSVILPIEGSFQVESLVSGIISETILAQQLTDISNYLNQLQADSSIENLKRERLVKQLSDIKQELSDLLEGLKKDLELKRSEFKKDISRSDSTQRTLNGFDVVHLLYSPKSNILVPISTEEKIPLSFKNFLEYAKYRCYGVSGHPEYLSGLIFASLQAGFILGLHALGASGSALSITFQFVIGGLVGAYNHFYRGIMDFVPDDANQTQLKYYSLRIFKDFVFSFVCLYTYKLLAGEIGDAMTLSFFAINFMLPSIISKPLGDHVMFWPRTIRELTGEKFFKPIKYLPGSTAFNFIYQGWHSLWKFAPKKVAELFSDRSTSFIGSMLIGTIGLGFWAIGNPMIMDLMKKHYTYNFFLAISNSIKEEDIDKLVNDIMEAVENHSFTNLDKKSGDTFDAVRRYSKNVKYMSRSLLLTLYNIKYSSKHPEKINSKRAKLQKKQADLLTKMPAILKGILIQCVNHSKLHTSLFTPGLEDAQTKLIVHEFVKSIKREMGKFFKILKRYDDIDVYIDKLNQIEADDLPQIPESYETTQIDRSSNTLQSDDIINHTELDESDGCTRLFTQDLSK